MKSFLILLTLSVPMGSSELTHNSAPLLDCTGCGGTYNGTYTNSACITITENIAGSLAPGSCTVVGDCKQSTPCTVSGDFTIANTGAAGCGTVYVRTRLTDTCIPGTTPLDPGQNTNIVYSGHAIPCASSLYVRVYTSDPGANCIINAPAGFSWYCYACHL
jgi:hypothetical protein